ARPQQVSRRSRLAPPLELERVAKRLAPLGRLARDRVLEHGERLDHAARRRGLLDRRDLLADDEARGLVGLLRNLRIAGEPLLVVVRLVWKQAARQLGRRRGERLTRLPIGPEVARDERLVD